MEGNSENNVFLNGKAQMVEMLQHMSIEERNKILTNVAHKNASMAKELRKKSEQGLFW